jgi:hypothetical protein
LWAPPLRMVKQSVTRTSPPPVRNVVSSTSVPSTYLRKLSNSGVAGAIEQYPARFQSSSRPKQLPTSNLGMQHQSMDARRDTSAAEWQSAMSP